MGLFSTDNSLRKEIKEAFARVKDELDEHLEAINDNTSELQANYEYIGQLELKFEKLNEKIEELRLLVQQALNQSVEPKQEEEQEIRLTKREREVFAVLYAAGTEKKLLRYKDISAKLSLSDLLVRNYITNLIEKNIPIVKKYIDREAYLELEKEFLELQATRGIVKLAKPEN